MVRTSFIEIPSGLDTSYKKVIQSGDRFILPHVKVKRLFSYRYRIKGLTQKSLMVELAPVWNAFSTGTRNAWNDAGAQCGMNGWRLFVQDTATRRANSISGYATPLIECQNKVGRMTVSSPALGLTIIQPHPQTYYINRKVSGTRSQYEPVPIVENVSLPVNIAISYKSTLTSVGSGARARFYITLYSSYQGRDLENYCVIDFSLSHDWERKTASISGIIGVFRGYTAYIEIFNANGTLLFDNVEIEHSGLNWARDPFCNSIQTSFTKAFYQIPRNWAPLSITSGAQYGSVYHTNP